VCCYTVGTGLGSTAKPEDFSLYAKIVASLKRKNFVSLTPLN
jgi:hypothetical protein